MKWDRALQRVPAALYTIARPDRDEETSDQLHAAACACGVVVVLDVIDSAGPDRPGLRRVLEAALIRQVAVVIVPRLDALGDSTSALSATIRVIRDAGCRLVVTSQALDVPAEGDTFNALVDVLAAVVALERDVSRRRAQRRAESARRVGKKPGRPPSRNAPDGARVRELRAQHCSWGQIAQRLHCTREAARRAFARSS